MNMKSLTGWQRLGLLVLFTGGISGLVLAFHSLSLVGQDDPNAVYLPVILEPGTLMTPTATLIPTHPPPMSATPETPTPTPTATLTPLASVTPSERQAPYAGAPLCPDSLHESTRFHTLWNAAAGCHYDHEHKHDPKEVDDIFGSVGAWFGGSEISYPWETPNENHHKHEAYGWLVRRDIPAHGENLWIKDFRLQFHAMSGPTDTVTRYHSFSLEARICRQDGQCGIVRRGGWIDFGKLDVTGYGTVPLPGQDDPAVLADDGRRRIHYFDNPEIPEFFWYGRNMPPDSAPESPDLSIALASGDTFSRVDPDNPGAMNFFCPDFHCDKNGSTIQAHVVQVVTISHLHDPDGDGFVDIDSYVDRYGDYASGCQEVSLDCTPILFEHVPLGDVQHRDDEDLRFGPKGAKDFDLSPPGEWWIRFPN
jgi:hypothetical protein